MYATGFILKDESADGQRVIKTKEIINRDCEVMYYKSIVSHANAGQVDYAQLDIDVRTYAVEAEACHGHGLLCSKWDIGKIDE